jgi:hypothetical protein
MINEYAIEPKILLNWASNTRNYTEFLRGYGVGTPRIISSFPKKRTSKLRSYFLKHAPIDDQSLIGLRYLEMVDKLVDSLIKRDYLQQQDIEWCQLAEAEHTRLPFDVILASKNIGSKKSITPENMYELRSIWNHPDQLNIQRTNLGFTNAVLNLIRLSTEHIAVIDTYGWTQEAIGLMKHMISCMGQNRVNSQVPVISLFYKKNHKSPDAQYVKQEIMKERNIAKLGIHLNVSALGEIEGGEVFHNRCILTEHGGVSTGHGIGVTGVNNHTDEATLMRIHIYQKKWNQFIENNTFQIISNA